MSRYKYWEECTRKEQVTRWKNVLRVLKGLTKHQRRDHFDMANLAEKTPCGTAACAAGHSGFDPWFRRRGYAVDFTRTEFDARDEDGVKLLDENGKPLTGYLFDARESKLSMTEFFGEEGTNAVFLRTMAGYEETVALTKDYIEVLEARYDL
jgi:hypothetical protein